MRETLTEQRGDWEKKSRIIKRIRKSRKSGIDERSPWTGSVQERKASLRSHSNGKTTEKNISRKKIDNQCRDEG